MKFWLLGLLFITTACGPVYTTDYQLIAPRTEQGRMCANNCMLASQNCKLTCQNSNLQCEQTARYRARSKFLEYKNDRLAAGKEVKRSEDSFYHTYDCGTSECDENCDAMMHSCYTTCGGQVVPHTYCSAFCK